MQHLDFSNSTNAYAEFGEDSSGLKYYLQSFKLPDITMSPIIQKRRGEELRIPGDSRVQDEIPLTFICDEQTIVFTSLYEKAEELRKKGISDEIFKIFITDTKYNPIVRYTFYGIFFTSIMGPSYDTKVSDTELFIDSVLHYTKFDYTILKDYK